MIFKVGELISFYHYGKKKIGIILKINKDVNSEQYNIYTVLTDKKVTTTLKFYMEKI